MIGGGPLTAIIPVRGGSKGIAGKNVRPVCGGDSLLERAIKFAKASSRIDRAIVSTDDRRMHAIAQAHGVASPTLRPAHLATDTATSIAVVEHVIDECGIVDGHILVLQATSPFRRLDDLEAMCRALEASGAEASVSLVAHDEPRPEKLKRIEGGRLVPYIGEGFEGPRQALPQPYRLNGAFYLIALPAFLRGKRLLPEGTLPFVMAEERSHNLDSPTDWTVMEAMVAAGHWAFETYDRS